jgi:hypothetical protein
VSRAQIQINSGDDDCFLTFRNHIGVRLVFLPREFFARFPKIELHVWANQLYYPLLMRKRKIQKQLLSSKPETKGSPGNIKTPIKVGRDGRGGLKGHSLLAALIAEKKIERER